MKTVSYIPIKTNNERFPQKNTREFFDGSTMLSLIQSTLLKSAEVDEIYVFCSDLAIREHCLQGVTFLERPKKLDGPLATPQDIMKEFIGRIEADIYVTAHATSPFVSHNSVNECVQAVKYGGYDSAFMARKLAKLLWNHRIEAMNFDPSMIPRTQDLDPIYAEVSAAYVFKKEVFSKHNRRVGYRPKIVEISELEAIDIDYPEDFKIADILYRELLSKK